LQYRSILIYSIFTGACGLAPGIVSLAIFRFLMGFGIGGEWAAGAPLLQESVPEHLRERLSGWYCKNNHTHSELYRLNAEGSRGQSTLKEQTMQHGNRQGGSR